MKSFGKSLRGIALPLALVFSGVAAPSQAQGFIQQAQATQTAPVIADHPAHQLSEHITHKVVEGLIADRDAMRSDKSLVYDLLLREMVPHLDFDAMTQVVLGRHARAATPAQREQFKQEFSRMLLGQFADTMSDWATDIRGVEIKPYRQHYSRDDIARVRTAIMRASTRDGVDFDLDLRRNIRGEWRIFNAEVMGINLGILYRDQFSNIIHNDGIDALTQRIRATNDRLGRPPAPLSPIPRATPAPAP